MARPKAVIDQDKFLILKKLGALPFDLKEIGVEANEDQVKSLSINTDYFRDRLLRTFPELSKRIKYAYRVDKNRTKEIQTLRSRIGTGISNHCIQNGYEHVSMSKQAIEIILGYTFSDLKISFDAKFQDGLNWENTHLWQIDHIKPMSLFKFKSFSDRSFLDCWSIDNLRPLCKKENRLKSDHYGDL